MINLIKEAISCLKYTTSVKISCNLINDFILLVVSSVLTEEFLTNLMLKIKHKSARSKYIGCLLPPSTTEVANKNIINHSMYMVHQTINLIIFNFIEELVLEGRYIYTDIRTRIINREIIVHICFL